MNKNRLEIIGIECENECITLHFNHRYILSILLKLYASYIDTVSFNVTSLTWIKSRKKYIEKKGM